MSVIVLTFKPHWLNGAWLKRFTDPYAELDGAVRCCSWSSPTRMETTVGAHALCTFVRYRRIFQSDGSSGAATIEVPAFGEVLVTTSNSFSNQSAFMPRRWP